MKIIRFALVSAVALTAGLCGLSEPAAVAKEKAAPPAKTVAPALPPQSVIDRFHDTLLEIMKQGPKLGFQGRYKVLAPVADQSFDFADMTEKSIGTRWAELSPADRKKLTAAFRKFSISTYAHEFKSYDGERFEKTGEPKTGRLGGVMVRTQIVPNGEQPVALNYLMHQTSPGWKIYDVYLAGAVSEVARRRDEFSGILRDNGVDGVLHSLDEKAHTLAAE